MKQRIVAMTVPTLVSVGLWAGQTAWAADGPADVTRPAVAAHAQWTNALKPKGTAGPELTLAAGGKALYTIVLPEKPTTMEGTPASTSVPKRTATPSGVLGCPAT